ncbi:hypothetical protein EYZ11_007788 [Aspergillus tanneri]|uniref:Cytochrome P450 n=1 Tax=Aspergillus tanneri TaxID=1220188 RepID=A0A4S3JCC0_9EURO|nr:uncharacterized protein ATNIH1004_006676 [Aspergillus tanneri]KAA8645257.1 hypothetical protein ATNIH1004_006676 [Aspergillus tanneri]THC92740.1 hypothetical protein EYZ11_007788 [Aspergillus tanneri]
MEEAHVPQFCPGRGPTLLSTFSQSLSFHASPQSFLLAPDLTDPTHPRGTTPNFVRAKILNRDVAVISSYRHCQEILYATGEEESSSQPHRDNLVSDRIGGKINPGVFTVGPAYRELMVDFFPAPNLLLLDSPRHQPTRQRWDKHMALMAAHTPELIRDCVISRVTAWTDGSAIDLYEEMKDLSRNVLCSIFLGLRPSDKTYKDIVFQQENLLRGQFSLFPVSIRTPFWCSSRSKGIDARNKLQAMLKEEMASPRPGCPFAHRSSDINNEELAANALLFTSSIAVKALASLLTAFLLNLFLFPCQPSLAAQVRKQSPGQFPRTLLRSILLETERLSPPVIGVMRRVEQDIILKIDTSAARPQHQSQVIVPAGWDVWLYFVNACRDSSVYDQPCKFVPERFMSSLDPDPGFAFGAGGKECLGKDLARELAETVALVTLEKGLDLSGSIEAEGVRGWLGWDEDVSADMIARDLKQLPTQRPRQPIKIRIRRLWN